jgi:ABC-type lipoprotein export system ATPase subunit
MKIDVEIRLGVDVRRTPRVRQVEGVFDLAPALRSELCRRHRFDLPAAWRVGAIVGPSGCGKTTLARRAFGLPDTESPWPAGQSVLDGFPPDMGIRRIVGLLSSVGFSSPPAWVRPIESLSTGEQFRVRVAREIARAMTTRAATEARPRAGNAAADAAPGVCDIAVVDEFTSALDRVTARVATAAVARAARRAGVRFVAVTCHEDVLDWLEPDWAYEPLTRTIWSKDAAQDELPRDPSRRGRLRRRYRRPGIELEIFPVSRAAWELFKPHHYLSGDIHPSAQCFMATAWDRPAAFVAVLSFPHPIRSAWREHRCVCLPDFQGVGIGNALSEFVASLFAWQKPYTSVTGHPAMIAHRSKSPLWRTIRKPAMAHSMGRRATLKQLRPTMSVARITAGVQYVGPTRREEAKRLAEMIKPAKKTKPARSAEARRRPRVVAVAPSRSI